MAWPLGELFSNPDYLSYYVSKLLRNIKINIRIGFEMIIKSRAAILTLFRMQYLLEIQNINKFTMQKICIVLLIS